MRNKKISLLHYCHNENYTHPEMPVGVEEGIIKNISFKESKEKNKLSAVDGSGTILREAKLHLCY